MSDGSISTQPIGLRPEDGEGSFRGEDSIYPFIGEGFVTADVTF